MPFAPALEQVHIYQSASTGTYDSSNSYLLSSLAAVDQSYYHKPSGLTIRRLASSAGNAAVVQLSRLSTKAAALR